MTDEKFKYQEALYALRDAYEKLAIEELHQTGWHLEDYKEYWVIQDLIDKLPE